MMPTIEEFGNEHLLEVHAQLAGKSLIISGDGRCDSPGSSAKFCTYTLMDTDSNLIVHSETVTKQEVHDYGMYCIYNRNSYLFECPG